jgi:dolichyl-phosphate-mannose-protein mannosyltransferase
VVAVLVALSSLGSVWWLERTLLTIPPAWDQSYYLYRSLRYWHAMSDGRVRALVREFVRGDPFTAPLFPLTTAPLYTVLWESRLVAYLTNAFYLALLLAVVMALGKYTSSVRAGLVAAVSLATFPAIVNYSRDYLFEFPATAFVSLTVYALLRADRFRSSGWSLLVGMAAALTVLTKTMAAVFLVGPVLWTAARALTGGRLTRPQIQNAVVAAGVAVLVAGVWWIPNLGSALWYLTFYGFQEGSVPYNSGIGAALSASNLSYYLRALVDHGVSMPYAILFAFVAGSAFTVSLVRGKAAGPQEHETAYFWVWLVSGYALLTVASNKGDARYALSLLPPIALIVAGGLDRIHHAGSRRALTVAVLVVGLFNYVALTCGLPAAWAERLPARVRVSHTYPQYEWLRQVVPPPSAGPIPLDGVLDRLDRDRAGGRSTKVLVVPDYPVFNGATLRYYAERRRSPRDFIHLSEGPITAARLAEFDYALVKVGGYQGPAFSTRVTDQLGAALEREETGFVRLGPDLEFPDGSAIVVYARRAEVAPK